MSAIDEGELVPSFNLTNGWAGLFPEETGGRLAELVVTMTSNPDGLSSSDQATMQAVATLLCADALHGIFEILETIARRLDRADALDSTLDQMPPHAE